MLQAKKLNLELPNEIAFDQNISFRILSKIKDHFPSSVQVRKEGLENSTDIQIWNYPKKNEFSIVIFDGDFCDLSIMKGCPPKIIWLRTGSIPANSIAELLINKSNLILEFIEFNDSLDEIEAVSEISQNNYRRMISGLGMDEFLRLKGTDH